LAVPECGAVQLKAPPSFHCRLVLFKFIWYCGMSGRLFERICGYLDSLLTHFRPSLSDGS